MIGAWCKITSIQGQQPRIADWTVVSSIEWNSIRVEKMIPLLDKFYCFELIKLSATSFESWRNNLLQCWQKVHSHLFIFLQLNGFSGMVYKCRFLLFRSNVIVKLISIWIRVFNFSSSDVCLRVAKRFYFFRKKNNFLQVYV